MKFPRAARRFLTGYLILHLLAAGFFVLVLTRLVRYQMKQATRAQLSAMTLLESEHLDQVGGGLRDDRLVAHVETIGKKTGMRFTLITDDGTVVADSIAGARDIGPHGTREEVLLAKKSQVGFSERYSATLDQEMMYCARQYQPSQPDRTGGFVRVAIPARSINAAISSIQGYVWMFAIGLSALTAFLMLLISAYSMEPLNMFSEAARRIGIGQYQNSYRLKNRRDEWGELANAFDQMQDEITRREDRLVENTQRLQAVLSSMIEGVVGLDSNGVVMLANDAACKMFSLSTADLKGRKLLDIVRNPELRQAIETAQDQRTFSKAEFETLTAPKRRLKARVSVLANPSVRNPEPQAGVAVVVHDVTELRQLETMRQDFVANVSHELKTPLSSIKAYAETLRLGAIHDQAKNLHFVERIEKEAELLSRQILDLLELARVESGTAVFRIVEVYLNDVCRQCVEQLSPNAQEGQVELRTNLSERSLVVQADADAVATILKNLVVNAIHYTPAGGQVTIETGQEGDQAVMRVVDTGIGIAPDQQTRVFERFYRVDRARSRDKGGTGLGLAIVKHLSQAFGGTVQLESQIGKGSRFTVRLPLSARRRLQD